MNIKEAIKSDLEIQGWLRKLLLYRLKRFHGFMDITDRKLRSTVKEMIEKDGEPIGTSSKRGYFIVKTQEEFNEATEDLRKKAMSILYRIKKLKMNIERETGKQLKL